MKYRRIYNGFYPVELLPVSFEVIAESEIEGRGIKLLVFRNWSDFYFTGFKGLFDANIAEDHLGILKQTRGY